MADYYVGGYAPPKGVDSREKVKEIQAVLQIKQDGIWGPQTQAAWENKYGGLGRGLAAMRRDPNRPYALEGELYTSPQDKLKYPVAIDNERARPHPNPVYTAKSTIQPERGTHAS